MFLIFYALFCLLTINSMFCVRYSENIMYAPETQKTIASHVCSPPNGAWRNANVKIQKA